MLYQFAFALNFHKQFCLNNENVLKPIHNERLRFFRRSQRFSLTLILFTVSDFTCDLQLVHNHGKNNNKAISSAFSIFLCCYILNNAPDIHHGIVVLQLRLLHHE